MKQMVSEIASRVEAFLAGNGLAGELSGSEIARLVWDGTAFAEWRLSDPLKGEVTRRLALLRLASPVVERDEAFLGTVLLNGYLAATLPRSCHEEGLGEILLLANDVENFYYLYLGEAGLEELSQAYLRGLECHLPDLYLGSHDPTRGIYGDLEQLLAFHKNNIEAFPIFVLPQDYCDRLWQFVMTLLLAEIEKSDFLRNPTRITANLSFFLSRDGAEFQSPYVLLARAATRYGLAAPAELLNALRLPQDFSPFGMAYTADGEKKLVEAVREALTKGRYDPVLLKKVLRNMITGFQVLLEAQSLDLDACYALSKALPLGPSEVVAELVSHVQLGYLGLMDAVKLPGVSSGMADITNVKAIPCRACGSRPALLKDQQITMGEDVNKFYNQIIATGSEKEPKVCLRCSLAGYLTGKLLGNIPGSLAFVPQRANLVFHYGDHNENQVAVISRVLGESLGLIRRRRDLQVEIRRLKKEIKQAADRVAGAKGARAATLHEEISLKERRQEDAVATLAECEAALLAGLGPDALTEPAVEIIADAGLAVNVAKGHYVFEVGMGAYRLMAFVLPEIRHRINKKGHDFVQQRFAASRATVLTVLAFLRRVCGCDGPYFYLTTPRFSAAGLSRDTFYVRNEAIDAAEVLEYHRVFTGLANDLVAYSDKVLVHKVLLSEGFLADPLVTLALVMRPGDDYRPLYDQISHRQDLPRYLEAYYRCRDWQRQLEKKEGIHMRSMLKEEQIEELMEAVFRALDNLGHYPVYLQGREASPSRLEKYPRLLFDYLARHENPELAYHEWASRVLRATQLDPINRKKATGFALLEKVREQLLVHAEVFSAGGDSRRKVLLQHLRGSLYARTFAYLTPRRAVALALVDYHRRGGNPLTDNLSELTAVVKLLEETELSVWKVRVSEASWPAVVQDSLAQVLTALPYYRRLAEGKTEFTSITEGNQEGSGFDSAFEAGLGE